MPRDVATTKYVRWRLLHWRDEAGDLRTPLQIQQETGAKASAISQIRAGKLGVGPAVISPLAKAWGMSEGQLIDAARDWYAKEGKDADDVVDAAARDPQLAEAMEVVQSLGRVSGDQLRAIVAGYGAAYFRGRDREWWITTLLAEAERLRKGQMVQEATEREQKKVQAKVRKHRREATSAKKRRPADNGRKAG